MKKGNYNIIIVGLGGQGLITLTKILGEAALFEGLDVKTSELHGLSQRGGSVETSIRFGPKVYSPLVRQGGADLIISLEIQEVLKARYYSTKKSTIFLINDFFKPIPGAKSLSQKKILRELRRSSKKQILIPANRLCQEKLGKEVVAGVYLISLATFEKLIPLKPNSIFEGIKKIIPEKYLELNLKAHELAKDYNLSI
jgi:indolepyruvate ferredoxin oxidoreductase beta subunit